MKSAPNSPSPKQLWTLIRSGAVQPADATICRQYNHSKKQSLDTPIFRKANSRHFNLPTQQSVDITIDRHNNLLTLIQSAYISISSLIANIMLVTILLEILFTSKDFFTSEIFSSSPSTSFSHNQNKTGKYKKLPYIITKNKIDGA